MTASLTSCLDLCCGKPTKCDKPCRNNPDYALRFRSGDHALVIDGQTIGAMAAKMAQKPRMKGFLASVACRLLPVAR